MSNALQGKRSLAADMQAGHPLLQELQGTVDIKVVVREGINPLRQTHKPASPRILSGKLWRHAELRQDGQVEWRPPRQFRLQVLDYLVSGYLAHG